MCTVCRGFSRTALLPKHAEPRPKLAGTTPAIHEQNELTAFLLSFPKHPSTPQCMRVSFTALNGSSFAWCLGFRVEETRSVESTGHEDPSSDFAIGTHFGRFGRWRVSEQ